MVGKIPDIIRSFYEDLKPIFQEAIRNVKRLKAGSNPTADNADAAARSALPRGGQNKSLVVLEGAHKAPDEAPHKMEPDAPSAPPLSMEPFIFTDEHKPEEKPMSEEEADKILGLDMMPLIFTDERSEASSAVLPQAAAVRPSFSSPTQQVVEGRESQALLKELLAARQTPRAANEPLPRLSEREESLLIQFGGYRPRRGELTDTHIETAIKKIDETIEKQLEKIRTVTPLDSKAPGVSEIGRAAAAKFLEDLPDNL
jgi:hypothetical protein